MQALVAKISKIALPITFSSSIISISNIIDLGITMRSLEFLGYSESQSSALYGNYTTLAVPMLNMVIAVLTPISVACLPHLVSAYLERNNKEFNKVLSSAISISALIGAPCAMIFFLYPFDILDVLFSSQASIISAELLSALSPAMLIVPMLTVINTALEATGKIRMSVCSLIFGALVKIVLSALLIKNPNIGILGAPIGTTLSYAVSLFLSLIFLKSDGKRSIGCFKVMRSMLASIFAYVPVFFLVFTSGWLGSGTTATIFCVLISTVIYCFMEFSTIKSCFSYSKNSKYEQKKQKAIIE